MGQCSTIGETPASGSEKVEKPKDKDQSPDVAQNINKDRQLDGERGLLNDLYCEATASGGLQDAGIPGRQHTHRCSSGHDVLDWRELPGGPMLRMFELLWTQESGYSEVHRASRVCRSWRSCALEILMGDTAASKPRRAPAAPSSVRTQAGTLPGRKVGTDDSEFTNMAGISAEGRTVEGGMMAEETVDCEAISRPVNGSQPVGTFSESEGARAGPSGYNMRRRPNRRGGREEEAMEMGRRAGKREARDDSVEVGKRVCSSYRTPSYRTTATQCRHVGSQTPSSTVEQIARLTNTVDRSDVTQGNIINDERQGTSYDMMDSEQGVIEGPAARVGQSNSAQSEPSNSVPQVLQMRRPELSTDEATSGQ